MLRYAAVAGHINHRSYHPVDKIAVMTDQQNGAVIFHQHFLQQVKRVHVQIVGRLVKHPKIRLFGQCNRQHQTILFSAGQSRNRALRLFRLKQKIFQIRHHMTVLPAHPDMVAFAAKGLPKRFLRVKRHAVLVKIGLFQIFAHSDKTGIRFQPFGQQLNQSCFAGAVWSHNADFVAFDNPG